MQKTWIGLAYLAAAVLAVPAALAVTPGKVEIFKDWTVGCDNGLDCQAVALHDPQLPDGHLSIVMTRLAGPGTSLSIAMSPDALQPGRYSIQVDGRTLTRGMAQTSDQPIQVTGPTALRLARAMGRGNVVRLLDGSNSILGQASLAGASATFRYIDARQGRVGARNAIVVVGGKTTASKPPVVPVVTARKITPSNILPDTAALIALSDSSPCSTARFESTEDTAYSLGTGSDGPQALVLLNCGAGAYNFSSGVYTAQRNSAGKWAFEPAKFDYGATGFTAESAVPILVNANWDAATQTLSSITKARGLGDCGSSASYVWDGQMFRLTAASFMGECRGSSDWIPTWRADVRLTP